ncbi:hypothetical protein MTR_2g450180 [Medicago truncatula]|uniref:Replication factor A C-terminal domain-containing protein n=1 Tax=Medicago truncatula TaxID=3880 RepID=A0A072V8E1_MEDTR|nr:hypothetical protein MTR_2g450180 [Medicago truncatula]
MAIIMVTVDQYITDDGWWYLSCVCHEQVVPDSPAYYCERCNKHAGVSSYVSNELLNMVGKCYLFKVFSKVGAGCDGEKCHPISKINDDEELIEKFKRHNSEVIKLDME